MKMRLLNVVAVALSVLNMAAVGADKNDQALILGTWKVIEYDQNGHRPSADILKRLTVTVQADKIVIRPSVVAQYKPVFAEGQKVVDVTFTTEAAGELRQ